MVCSNLCSKLWLGCLLPEHDSCNDVVRDPPYLLDKDIKYNGEVSPELFAIKGL